MARARILGRIDRAARGYWKPTQLTATRLDTGGLVLKATGGNTWRLSAEVVASLLTYCEETR